MNRNNNSSRETTTKLIILGTLTLAVLVLAITFWPGQQKPSAILSISDVAAGIASGQITQIDDTLAAGELWVHYSTGTVMTAVRDPNAPLLEQLSLLGVKQEQLARVQFSIRKTTSMPPASQMGILVALTLVGVAVFVGVKARSGELFSSEKKRFEVSEVPEVCFKDVAGIDEIIEELQDMVTFLKNGDRYAEMGASMPRGILMVGDPGTGKTLIAKAVAGEAGVPFYAVSGSEFTEVFVGVGASRMRALFQKARKKAPCIIFIDELDAVGRARRRTESGAEMEQDQTLNQLLVEMDGFDRSENIVVLAATNRVDVLDPALTRPGRFDRRVFVNRPDVKGRQAILDIHVKGKKLARDVSLVDLAKSTPGLVGADLATIVNEAAIVAVRYGRNEIGMQDFEEAVTKLVAGGVARKNTVMSPEEKRIIAFHEAGHAVAIHETRLADPVYKITIIPRGQMGGFTMALPEQESLLASRGKILARIVGLLGGRAAEEIFFNDVTSGASNDLIEATKIAEEMVMRLGMDPKAGLRVFPTDDIRFAFAGSSQKTVETLDQAVKAILADCYKEAKRIVSRKRARVTRLAKELLEVETVDRERFLEIMGK